MKIVLKLKALDKSLDLQELKVRGVSFYYFDYLK